MTSQKIRLRGAWWNLLAEPSRLGAHFRLLDRIHWEGQVRQHRECVRRIDASIEELQQHGYLLEKENQP